MEEATTQESRSSNPVHKVIDFDKVFPFFDWPEYEWKVKLKLE
jgi:hypothetical protein